MPTKDFLWIAYEGSELEAQFASLKPALQSALQSLAGVKLLDLYVSDLLNERLTALYDYTAQYDLWVFRHLTASHAGEETQAVQAHNAKGQCHRTNDIMRTLTARSAVFLPLNFLAGVFGRYFCSEFQIHAGAYPRDTVFGGPWAVWCSSLRGWPATSGASATSTCSAQHRDVSAPRCAGDTRRMGSITTLRYARTQCAEVPCLAQSPRLDRNHPMDLKPLVTLLAIVNPLAIVPFFIHYTQSFSEAQRRNTVQVSSLSAFVVIAVSALAGLQILEFFGISLASFQVGGGMLLLTSALNMLNAQPAEAKTSSHELEDGVEKAAMGASIAVVPLTIPLLTGPATMSTVVIYAEKAKTVLQMATLVGYGVVVALATALCFSLAQPIARVLGKTGINVMTRLMGLILAALAVEVMSDGLTKLFPVLGH